MRYLTARFGHLLVVLFAVTFLTFMLVNVLPGDVAYDMAGLDASEEEVEAIREEIGLNRPALLRYVEWLGGILTGDWGKSFITSEPVWDAIKTRFPVSLELVIVAQIMALLLALPLGIISALRVNSRFDRVVAVGGFFCLSVPNFMMAIILIYVFGLWLNWLPVTGYEPLSEGLWANLRNFILPSASFALAEWTILARVLRSDMIGVLQEDYISMARAKGMPVRRILWVHALRPSSFSLITIFGLQVGALIGGSIIIESIFALPGVGRLLIQAIFLRDFMVIQGCVTFIAMAYVVINFSIDICYALLDPRIRVARSHG
ncbi:MAG: ABC transporter permease [Rhodospirillaceae bacterium]|jgi:peptide/nickel transport system permease protein|nr:ABC transporter permease [Rhodospirillaceae bacterium]MBT5191326.1 ABC transporter permease [Rhodospirillaceae bacterium]MBT5899308.1 ABC transporter permease [Rhodospirillaceae bacterium]MBT6429637.1 ABC transporter permease [Rhodospirillaceae bacterium]MBT7759232.1 ABC transporter permease [Rhodospirillaceae bacterium]